MVLNPSLIQHFPGMENIARKTRLAHNLERMKKHFRRHYSFFPTTYILPRDLSLFKKLFQSGKSKQTYIIKPDGGCKGRGIFLTNELGAVEDVISINSQYVAQHYIRNPLLIDNKKFDLRLYVLVTSCNPLRIYIFKDGLVRICTENFVKPTSDKFEETFTNLRMHLSNYAINKTSNNFEGNEDNDAHGSFGSKRSVKWLISWLSKQYGVGTTEKLWSDIGEICVKTILSIIPNLVRDYDSIFRMNDENHMLDVSSNQIYDKSNINNGENDYNRKPDSSSKGSQCVSVLGFDIMITSKCKPHLIEVNHLPSFAGDSPLDNSIKSKVVYQSLLVMHELFSVIDKRKVGSMKHCPTNGVSPRKGKNRKSFKNINREIGSNQKKGRQTPKDIISGIYATHAPEKLKSVKSLLFKYRGYEDWLINKLQQKYEPTKNCEHERKQSLMLSSKLEESGNRIFVAATPNEFKTIKLENLICENQQGFENEEKILLIDGDFQLLYPPPTCNTAKGDMYDSIMSHAFQEDLKQHKRFMAPLSHTLNHAYNTEKINSGMQNHFPKIEGDQKKILVPPSDKQIQAFNLLSKGLSVADLESSPPVRLQRFDIDDQERQQKCKAQLIPKIHFPIKQINLQFCEMNSTIISPMQNILVLPNKKVLNTKNRKEYARL